MNRLGPSLLVVALLGATTAGCVVTEERLVSTSAAASSRHMQEDEEADEEKKGGKEAALKRYTEEHPEDPRGWWQIGDYYEGMRLYPPAIEAYQQLRSLCLDPKVNQGHAFTAGDYHVGVALAKARIYGESVPYLRAVLALQPKDDTQASLNRHFREAHYWLGAIYYENKQWEPAREHFNAFLRIGGERHRVDPWLLRIEDATGLKDGTIERVPPKQASAAAAEPSSSAVKVSSPGN